jgi:inhibitor of KinA sporulation pathway (predicted exonuclease)
MFRLAMPYPAVDFYLVVDLEATCCDDRSIPHGKREIIEIGAVMVNRDFQVESEFQSFVRPVKYPVLTPFCRDLTSITQEIVETAPTYPIAIAAFTEWIAKYPDRVFCAWGDFDRRQIQQECKRHGLINPIQSTCLNLRTLFGRSQSLPGLFNLNQALTMANLTFTGVHHRGIDDARNIAKLLPYCLGLEGISGRS